MATTRKLFIQMSGAPGSGKSTLGSLLAQSLNGIVINHDILKSFFLEHDLGTSFKQIAKLTYSLQWTLAEEMLKQNQTVIIDSTCNFEETLAKGAALAERHSFDYIYVECKIDDIDLLDKRLQSRISLRSQRKGVDIPPLDASSFLGPDFDHRAQYKQWMDNPRRPVHGAIIVDSSLSPQECLSLVLSQIDHRNCGKLSRECKQFVVSNGPEDSQPVHGNDASSADHGLANKQ